VDGVGAGAEDPRLLTGLQLRLNGRGWLPDQRRHVFVVDVPDPFGEPPVAPVGRAATGAKPVLVQPARQLTSGDFDHQSLAVTDSEAIVVSARHAGREYDLREDLVAVALAPAPEGEGEVRAITGPLPDGRVLAALSPVVVGDTIFRAVDCGTSGLEFVGVDSALYRVPLAGGEPTLLTDPATTDLMDLRPDGSGTGALAVVGERGVGVACRVRADGGLERLSAPFCHSVVGIAGDGRTVVAAVVTPSSPGELCVLGEGARFLTDFAAGLREAAEAVLPTELVATAPDGAPVHGWVHLPPGPGPHPVLLTIHGGPFASYGPCFFDETQAWVGAGYAVVMCNPRGSSGYGEAHGRAIEGAMGDRDAVDVLAFLDHALAQVPGLDGDRVGVMGGSYGGYLSAWLIAHEHRFTAAIVERAYLDPRSFVGASDIGWFFPAGYHRDKAGMDSQSPLLLADKVRTPTLVLHSEEDLRCPLADALRYYTELKLVGVEAQLLVFPGENHELSRSGRPIHRRQRLEAILAWWQRHLPVPGAADGETPAA
jgi:dipeptidyl aminopeptidase/acylaminoacyl peptidase